MNDVDNLVNTDNPDIKTSKCGWVKYFVAPCNGLLVYENVEGLMHPQYETIETHLKKGDVINLGYFPNYKWEPNELWP